MFLSLCRVLFRYSFLIISIWVRELIPWRLSWQMIEFLYSISAFTLISKQLGRLFGFPRHDWFTFNATPWLIYMVPSGCRLVITLIWFTSKRHPCLLLLPSHWNIDLASLTTFKYVQLCICNTLMNFGNKVVVRWNSWKVNYQPKCFRSSRINYVLQVLLSWWRFIPC